MTDGDITNKKLSGNEANVKQMIEISAHFPLTSFLFKTIDTEFLFYGISILPFMQIFFKDCVIDNTFRTRIPTQPNREYDVHPYKINNQVPHSTIYYESSCDMHQIPISTSYLNIQIEYLQSKH